MDTRMRAIAVVVAIGVAAVVAMVVINSRDTAAGGSHAGRMIAPDQFRVSEFIGTPVVVNVFGSWCPPCNAEAPDLATFAEQNPGAQVVGVASQDTEEDALGFMKEYGLSYPLVVDDGRVVQALGVSAFPTTIFYDSRGTEVDRLVGAASLEQFTASLAKAQ